MKLKSHKNTQKKAHITIRILNQILKLSSQQVMNWHCYIRQKETNLKILKWSSIYLNRLVRLNRIENYAKTMRIKLKNKLMGQYIEFLNSKRLQIKMKSSLRTKNPKIFQLFPHTSQVPQNLQLKSLRNPKFQTKMRSRLRNRTLKSFQILPLISQVPQIQQLKSLRNPNIQIKMYSKLNKTL